MRLDWKISQLWNKDEDKQTIKQEIILEIVMAILTSKEKLDTKDTLIQRTLVEKDLAEVIVVEAEMEIEFMDIIQMALCNVKCATNLDKLL